MISHLLAVGTGIQRERNSGAYLKLTNALDRARARLTKCDSTATPAARRRWRGKRGWAQPRELRGVILNFASLGTKDNVRVSVEATLSYSLALGIPHDIILACIRTSWCTWVNSCQAVPRYRRYGIVIFSGAPGHSLHFLKLGQRH
jgi:hypothetical protein